MSEPRMLPIRATFAGRWQIPLLMLGLCSLGGGLYRIAAASETVTFEERVERVRQLLDSDSLVRANAYLTFVLKEVELTLEQRGQLHFLMAATFFQAEAKLATHVQENVRSVITNFHTAVRFGAEPSAQDWIFLGEAYGWSGQRQDSVTAFHQALRLDPARSDRIHRRIFELQRRSGQSIGSELLTNLDAILTNEDATPENYRWALDQKAQWLLARGEAAEALDLVEGGKKRLEGTAERLALTYTEALCLQESGRKAEAETRLRSLRNHWTKRDLLWGRTGWLLGRLQQEEDRPQAALSFYEEVLVVFQSGDLHDACELGRAECLVMLGRHERSLEVFERLKWRALERQEHQYLDRDVLRTAITTAGESRFRDNDQSLGLRFLELALELLDEQDALLRSQYLARIAGGLAELAKEARGDSSRPEGEDEAKVLFARAAQQYRAQAEIMPLDEEAAARALLLSGDHFDAAGETDEVIEVLSEFVRGHPAHLARPDALYRLGRAQQAIQDFTGAINSYEKVIKEYPRVPAALRSMVPLAESLLSAGAETVGRGVAILVDIVDDRGADPLFGPQAKEYRQALFRLAEYYSHADKEQIEDHFEKAIVRLEDAVALYPDDPAIPRLKFLLAESYRKSAQRVREDKRSADDTDAMKEINRRLALALKNYGEVRDALARHDSEILTDLEKTYLRASYLYIGDCLFDLERLEPAIEAYREAAWRYENQPAAVSATMQVVHCYQRLGRLEEARAALARLQWLLKKIPAEMFDAEFGMSSKPYWNAFAKRVERTGIY
ncbi:MAG: tetratricopeptide repeat protein [Phycisphaerales bacterium]|nr:tetratricopeptide repeat protein [Phycisphaerales bacterium]